MFVNLNQRAYNRISFLSLLGGGQYNIKIRQADSLNNTSAINYNSKNKT